MRGFCIILVLLVLILPCNGQEAKKVLNDESNSLEQFSSFGQKIDRNNVIANGEMAKKYKKLNVGDALSTKFSTKVTDVCQVKGCWMKLKLNDGKDVMVRFKDYGFFVPKNSAGRTVIVSGRAFVEEMTVEDQRHYARDAGQSEDAIAKITKPKKTFGFEADGVLLKKQ